MGNIQQINNNLFKKYMINYISIFQLGLQCIQLNDYTFHQIWSTRLQKQLYQVENINIFQIVLSEQNYLKLFSHQLPKIRSIIFYESSQTHQRERYLKRNVLTPRIVEKIFTAKYFSRLENLNMINTNLQFRHLEFLNNPQVKIQSNLNNLTLSNTFFYNTYQFIANNFLQKRGFELLSRIQFNGKLQGLGLGSNSLYQSQCIDSLIKILKPKQGNLSTLKNISLYDTQISTDNFIRLLDSIDTDKLISLNIGKNAFQHSLSFDIPFNNTVYQYLSTKNFSSLRRLYLTTLDLDQQQLQYLKKIKIPKIQVFSLMENFVIDDYFIQWINKKNMPKLQNINLIMNDLTDKAVEFLVNEEFQHLEILELGNNKRLTNKYVQHLKKLDSKKLKSLSFSFNAANDKSMRQFFQNRQFDNLQVLLLQRLRTISNLFQYINWKSLKNLRYINFGISNIVQSIQEIIAKNITIPSLKRINFGGLWLNQYNLFRFINCLKMFAPNLKLLTIISNQNDRKTAVLNISRIQLNNIPDGLYIKTPVLKIYKPQNIKKLQIIQMVFDQQFFKQNFHFDIFGFDSNFDISLTSTQQFILRTVEYLKSFTIFDNIQTFSYGGYEYFDIFKKVVQNNTKRATYLPYLNNIIYTKINNKSQVYFPFMMQINAPMVQMINIQGLQHNNTQYQIQKLLSKYNNTKYLSIPMNSLTCQLFNKQFNRIKLSFLYTLNIQLNRLQISCIKQFLSNHRLIRQLDVTNNFLERGLFDKVIKENQIMLQQLTVSNIQLGNQQFKKIASINRLFIISFVADRIHVNVNGIKMLINDIYNTTNNNTNNNSNNSNNNNSNNKNKLFYKLHTLQLPQNNINDQGVNLLLSTGMPYIQTIVFFQVDNPNLINTLLSYPNHLYRIQTNDANIYGLKQTIDPRSTRNLDNIHLQSGDMTVDDYKILANTNLKNLKYFSLTVNNLFQCEALKYLIKIAQNVQIFDLTVLNEKIKGKQLNDECLQQANETFHYVNHLHVFLTRFVTQHAYIPKFYEYFYYPGQMIQALIIQNNLIGDKTLLKIVQKCDISRVLAAILVNNLLTDKSISQFFRRNISNVNLILLRKNLFTSQGLKPIIGQIYPHIDHFDLGLNNIDDRAIDYVVQAYMPRLTKLALDNTQITIKGLMKVFEMNAPMLQQVGVMNNKLNQKDLVYLVKNLPFQKFPFLKIVATTVPVSKKFEQQIKILISRRTKQPFQIKMQVYNVEEKNVLKRK